MPKKAPVKRPKPAPQPVPPPTAPPSSGLPNFGEPQPGPDPSGCKVPHPSDAGLYKLTDRLLVEPFPAPRGGVEPVITLAEVWGAQLGPGKAQAIEQAGQIVFHSVGDTGSVIGPATESAVADAAQADLVRSPANAVPAFFLHLGDWVYSFGEARYWYDQFYAPWRAYQGPILGVAGNHDGVVYKGDPAPTLDAWLRNLAAAAPAITPEAGGLLRTAMTQPGVFYTFDAPFVRVLALYSNVLEDPGVISTEGGARPSLNDSQLAFLEAALARCKQEKYAGAVVIAVHHPPYTGGTTHGGSPRMLADMDAAATKAGFWPHAVFSGHAHNYQRFTRTVNPAAKGEFQVAYVVAGNGGHGLNRMRAGSAGAPMRVPVVVDPTLTLENYDDTHYGFLRVSVDAATLRVEYHQAGMTAPFDVVSVDLGTRTVS